MSGIQVKCKVWCLDFSVLFDPQGTCMFVWECLKTEGQHLGKSINTTTRRFLNGVLSSQECAWMASCSAAAASTTRQTTWSASTSRPRARSVRTSSYLHIFNLIRIFRDFLPPLPPPPSLPSDGRQPTIRSAAVFPTTKTTTSDRNVRQGLYHHLKDFLCKSWTSGHPAPPPL